MGEVICDNGKFSRNACCDALSISASVGPMLASPCAALIERDVASISIVKVSSVG